MYYSASIPQLIGFFVFLFSRSFPSLTTTSGQRPIKHDITAQWSECLREIILGVRGFATLLWIFYGEIPTVICFFADSRF